jgi:hypothetical protein
VQSYLVVPLAAVAALILCAVALGPAIWLTRSRRALRLRGISGRTLLTTSAVAAIPWIGVLAYLHFVSKLSLSANVNGIAQLLGFILVALVIFAVLVSAPLGVIVLSIIWLLDRNASPARGATDIRA